MPRVIFYLTGTHVVNAKPAKDMNNWDVVGCILTMKELRFSVM
jgi:hypothetical protein